MASSNDIIKSREIHFRVDNGERPAEYAAALLRGVPGIKQAMPRNPSCLNIHYDVRSLTLHMLESALTEAGFELDNGLMQKIKRAIFAYIEDALRARLGIGDGATEQQAISLPKHFAHDPRPDNWRNYT